MAYAVVQSLLMATTYVCVVVVAVAAVVQCPTVTTCPVAIHMSSTVPVATLPGSRTM